MAAPSFADVLKQARLAAGLSQAALARASGTTGSYISLLESRRRRPPSPRVIKAICRALSIDAAPLLEAAALERSPPTVRRRIERMHRERGRVQKTRDRLLTTTLFHLARGPRVVDPMALFLDLPPGQQALVGRLLGRARRARSADDAESRADDILEEVGPDERDALARVLPRALTPDAQGADDDAPTEGPEPGPPTAEPVLGPTRVPVREEPDEAWPESEGETRTVEAERWTPRLFFWRVPGDEAHPRVEAGDLVLVDPSAPVRDGDLVVVSRDDTWVVGTWGRRGGDVLITFPRPERPPLRFESDDARAAGVVLEIRRELT